MKLTQLILDLELLKVVGDTNIEITGISYDSRTVSPGDLFVTWRGTHTDGRTFVDEALARGAVALCVEGEDVHFGKVPYLIVRDARLALAGLARLFYGDPGQDLTLLGVTGTNGKTTVTFLMESVLQLCGYRPGLLGTIHYKIGERLIPSERTTPESLDLQKYFREMVEKGCRSCVMEVSSHALDQGRVQGVDFDGAVFTNLSQDHLDYHEDLEEYFNTKAKLFEGLTSNGFAIINADDSYGMRLVDKTRAKVITYGFSKSSTVWMDQFRLGTGGSFCQVVFPEGRVDLELWTIGRFNLYNVLAAFAALWALGINPQKIKKGLEGFQGVPGRMEFVPIEAPFQVVVDYAHTEDALRNVLGALRPLVSGRLITVFGCGGDRDRLKRPKMGQVAAQFSDFVVVTSDNPRSEDPAQIAGQIEEGLKGIRTPFQRILDRRSAIEFALGEARPQDLVLVAGKGHEKFQEVGPSRIPFDDVAQVLELSRSMILKVGA